MQLQLLLNPGPAREIPENVLVVGSATLSLELVRNPRARRYVLRLGHDGVVRVTVPRGGSAGEARKMAQHHHDWLDTQLQKRKNESGREEVWCHGTGIRFRGEVVRLEVEDGDAIRLVRFADQSFATDLAITNLRPAVERQLWKIARAELPPRVRELAAQHAIPTGTVSVRNQRSRWGSCSRNGAISLNWRLVQMPAAIRDYIILHELAHVRVPNHSARYWRCVAQLCPDYRAAEAWLKDNGRQLQWMRLRGSGRI